MSNNHNPRQPLPDAELEKDVLAGVRWLGVGGDPVIVLSALALTALRRPDIEKEVMRAHKVLKAHSSDVVLRSLVLRIQQLLPEPEEQSLTANDVLGSPADKPASPASTDSTDSTPRSRSQMISSPGRTRRPPGVPDPIELGEQKF